MIIQPGEQKFGIKAGPYPVITTADSFIEYSKNKRERFIVELASPLLPVRGIFGTRAFEVDPERKTFRPRAGKTSLSEIGDFKVSE